MPKPVLTSGKKRISRGAVILFSILIVFMLVASSIIWLRIKDAWQEQPALLRVMNGRVQVYASHEGKLIETSNQLWIHPGNCIKVADNSTAVLQYFDRSTVNIEGPAEVHHDWSRRPKGAPQPGLRSISLGILSGDITIAATRQIGNESLFGIHSLDSMGVIQGAMLNVIASDGEPTTWEVSQGAVNIGAFSVDNDKSSLIGIVRLRAGEGLKIPALNFAGQADEKSRQKLNSIAIDIINKGIQHNRVNVAVKGAKVLAFNEETYTAVYKITSFNNVFRPVSLDTLIPPGNETMKNEVLNQFAPGLFLYKATSLKPLTMLPLLALIEGWDADAPEGTLASWDGSPPEATIVRKSPPKYSYSVLNIGKPIGIAVDSLAQRVYVTESDFERVTRVFDFKGNKLMDLAPPGTSASGRAPVYVAINPLFGTVYISDRSRNTIDVYDSLGIYLGVFQPKKESGLTTWSPLGLTMDKLGNLYVTDVTGNQHRVLVFDPSGNLKLQIGTEGKEDGQFSFPNDLAIDKDGKIYVADSNNYRIQVFDAAGKLQEAFTKDIGKTVGFPRGVKIEGHYIYVVDTFSHMVNVYDIDPKAQKKLVFSFGQRGVGDGEFNFPNGLAIDSESRIYVTDRENNRFQVWGY